MGASVSRGLDEYMMKENGKPSCSPSSHFQLKGLEPSANRGTARALPTGAVLGHEDLDAGRAEAANAFRAGVGALELRHALAGGAVNMNDGGRGIGWRRIVEPARCHVEVVAALDRREGICAVRVGRRGREGLLQRRRLVAAVLDMLLLLLQRRQRASVS